MKTPFEQISKQQNQELLMRIERLEMQLNNTLELIDERFIDQLDKADRDFAHQNHVTRQLEEIEFSIMETDKRLEIIDAENVFLTYDEKLRDFSLKIESLINQTESNDVADQIDDSSRLLEDRIMQNTKMIGENRAEIYSIAKNQSELVNRVSSIETISKNETHLLTESLSQISDKLNKTIIEMQANSTKEFEEISNTIHQILNLNQEVDSTMQNVSKSLVHLNEQMLSNSTSLQSQIISQKKSFKSFEAEASESLKKITDQLLTLNSSVIDAADNQSSTRKEDNLKPSFINRQS